MSPIYGDLNIINGRILNLKTELGDELPAFDAEDIGRLFFAQGVLSLNDGNEWVTLQISNTTVSNPLIVTLGDNWINDDLSFDPSPFNALANISGLTANDSLFSVIAALDAAITNIGTINLADLGDVSFGSLEVGDVVYWTGTAFANISLNNLASARLSLSTTALKDVLVTEYSTGDLLVFSNGAKKLVNRQVMFTYTSTATDSAFAVPHQLGNQFPIVQIVNFQTKEAITSGYTITYNDINNLTVTLATPAAVVIVAMAVNSD